MPNVMWDPNIGDVKSPVLTTTAAEGIISGTVQTQAGATQLTAATNRITTNASAGNGVRLMASGAGANQVVINATANALKVYGISPDTIDTAATATGVSIPANKTASFHSTVIGAWHMNLSS